MDNRRQLPRWEIKKEAKVWLSQMEGYSHCFIEDMHLKGMCVSFNNRLPQQVSLNMSFSIGDSLDSIKVDAQVSWGKEDNDRYVYGLSFSKIDDQDKNRLDKYITANCYDQIKNKWWE